MPTYATQAECESYIEGLTVTNTAGFARLIERAERDVDAILIPKPLLANGLKYDPTAITTTAPGYLTAVEKTALARGVCAQVEYRLEMGEEFMVRSQYEAVGGPDFNHRGQLDYIGPKVYRELGRVGLLDLTHAAGITSLRITTPLSPPDAA